MPLQIFETSHANSPGKKIVVPVSGGKDSTACLLLALQRYDWEDVFAVHNDTGWDHPLTYQYLEYLSDATGVPIAFTKSHKGASILDLIREYKKWPFAHGRFCTREFKQNATTRWLKENRFHQHGSAEVWLGIRLQESTNRRRGYEHLEGDKVYDYQDVYKSAKIQIARRVKVRFPILDWSEKEVFDFIDPRVGHNPLYDEGTNSRVGCYPCMLASGGVQKRMFATEEGQRRLEVIKQLEREIGQPYPLFDTDQGSCDICAR